MYPNKFLKKNFTQEASITEYKFLSYMLCVNDFEKMYL